MLPDAEILRRLEDATAEHGSPTLKAAVPEIQKMLSEARGEGPEPGLWQALLELREDDAEDGYKEAGMRFYRIFEEWEGRP